MRPGRRAAAEGPVKEVRYGDDGMKVLGEKVKESLETVYEHNSCRSVAVACGRVPCSTQTNAREMLSTSMDGSGVAEAGPFGLPRHIHVNFTNLILRGK